MPSLFENKRWEVLSSDEGACLALEKGLGVSSLVAKVLCARGVTDVDDARAFVSSDLRRDWIDPAEIPGMLEAASRVEDAIRHGETIAVFGDFDVDGMTSTCLLTQALRRLGAKVDPYIPHRFSEGYGLTRAALTRVIEGSNPDLIITVDNGIAAGEEVSWLCEQGIDVVVTDHHEPADLVPTGVPVTDPKLSATCRSRELAGAGVALKLVDVLGRRFDNPDLWWEYCDLAALGTVSDMMLLVGENRSLVAEGIARMRVSTRPGFVALAATASIDLNEIEADNLPFTLIPRLNAAGRMGSTDTAFDLLISEDMEEALTLAARLESINNERREIESSLSDEAFAMLEKCYHGEQVIVVGGQGWHEGVKGIVASRIVSRFHVPTIVLSITDGIARGSGRSVGSVDLFHAVEQCQDLLVRFGGHAGAVGVTLEEDKIDDFRERLCEVMGQLPEDQFQDRGEVAAIASLSELTQRTIDELGVLAPFGQGNKRPLFGIRGVFMRNRSRVGYDSNHLRFTATDGISQVPAIMFRTPDMSRAYACDQLVDLVVDAVNETWQGRTNPKLMVQDICYYEEAGSPADCACMSRHGQEGDRAPERPRVEVDVEACERLLALAPQELYAALERSLWPDGVLTPQATEVISLLRSHDSVVVDRVLTSRVLAQACGETALISAKTTLVVCPRLELPRLSDALSEQLAPLGISCMRVPHHSSKAYARHVLSCPSQAGEVLLATPEWLGSCEGERLGQASFGLVVLLGMAKERVGACVRTLDETGGDWPLLIEASDGSVRGIVEGCGLPAPTYVGAPAPTAAVEVRDLRGARDRDQITARICACGRRTIVCFDSWNRASAVAATLSRSVPSLAGRVAVWHRHLPREQRLRIADAFRAGEISCIASCGVPLEPQLSADEVVLYHLPTGPQELRDLRQVIEPAGRLYLLFGARDASMLEHVIARSAPGRPELVALWRVLSAESKRVGQSFVLSDADIAERMVAANPLLDVNVRTCATGVKIFEELGFLTTTSSGQGRVIRMEPNPGHMELTESVRYVEGHAALDDFRTFSRWMLVAAPIDICRFIFG